MSVTKDYKYSWEHAAMRTTKKHRRIYEDHYNIRLSSDIEIHHIDGNHDNNLIENLKPVSITEHFQIHYNQGDYAAAFRISQRMMVSPEEKSRLASLAAKKANAEGKCGFKLGHASNAGKRGGKKGGAYAKENKVDFDSTRLSSGLELVIDPKTELSTTAKAPAAIARSLTTAISSA